MNGFISTIDMSDEEAVARARQWPGLAGVDYVKEVTHKESFVLGRIGQAQRKVFNWFPAQTISPAIAPCRRRTAPSPSSPTITG